MTVCLRLQHDLRYRLVALLTLITPFVYLKTVKLLQIVTKICRPATALTAPAAR
jgi:hypothetical protein